MARTRERHSPAAARCIADARNPQLITHALRDILRQRVYALALGWKDLNDHNTLRRDVALQSAVGVDHETVSAPTPCRLESWSWPGHGRFDGNGDDA